MKTRSQTAPKPLKTVRLPPTKPSPKPPPPPPPSSRKKAQPLVDRRRPKKPPTAFFYFMEDFRKTFKEENPSVKSMQEVGKACGEKWNTMIFEERVKYYDLATEKRAEYEKAMAEYNKKKESGEFSEESDCD
ncbi:high mobility group B protein 14 [Oryza brachyantha]|uniref:high mobility group B protein 14 n=1 Tax=Oryza brachyantha TaxID=4533 RepID=UPI001ADC9154|nr:high mobility group B protein 14 [Oryza brachyantha]